MSADNLDGFNLKEALVGGLINESVMQTIQDISNYPLPLTDAIGSGTHGNEYREWTLDELAAGVIDNAEVDGRASTDNDAVIGTRVGNHSQISTKDISVSTRADASDTIGRAKETTYQISRRQTELRRDCEAAMLSNNASVAGTDAVAGVSGGLQSWLNTNSSYAADGTAGGYATGTGLTVAAINGTAEALTETKVRDVCQSVYEEGGNPTMMMAVPTVIRKFSEYLFTSSARIATLTAETGQSQSAATAKGSVNVFVTDFGVTLDLVSNRHQVNYTTAESAAFIIDPSMLEWSALHGYRAEQLAKVGLSESWLMSVDWTLVCNTEKAHGVIGSIDNTAAVTA